MSKLATEAYNPFIVKPKARTKNVKSADKNKRARIRNAEDIKLARSLGISVSELVGCV